MAHATVSVLERQVNRVRRRLLLQQILVYLTWSWLAAVTASVIWFLLQPLVIADAAPWLRWAVLAGSVTLATVASVVLALMRAPSTVTAALSLDERFQLRERVTTSLTMGSDQASSPAGQALLADVGRKLDPVRVGDRFPITVPWTAWLVPAAGAALALIAVFYNPTLSTVNANENPDQPLAMTKEVKDEVQKKLDKLKKPEPKPNDQRPKSQELNDIEMQLDKLAHKPHDTREEATELVAKMTDMEDKLKKAQQDLNDKAEAKREALKQINRVMKNQAKDGPGNDLQKALQKNDMKKAEEELDKLSQKLQNEQKAEKLKKKLEDPNLSKEEREKTQQDLDKLKDKQMSKEQKEQLQDQLGQMKDQLERLTRKEQEDKEKEKEDLEKKKENGEITEEQLKKALEDLQKGKMCDKDLQDLKDLADKLGEVQQAMKDGKDGDAGKKLEELADELDQLDRENSGEGKAIRKKLQELQEAKKSMCQGLDGNCQGDKDFAKGAGQATGRRPLVEDDNTGKETKRERAQLDTGSVRVVDTVPGQGIKSPKTQEELREDIQRASQEAPEAIDRMRLPKSAGDMTRGYFDKLRGSDKKPADQPK
jgi:hypothetical protein